MPAPEQELPSLFERFEHDHSGSVIHLCMSKVMTENRSLWRFPRTFLMKIQIPRAWCSRVSPSIWEEPNNDNQGEARHHPAQQGSSPRSNDFRGRCLLHDYPTWQQREPVRLHAFPALHEESIRLKQLPDFRTRPFGNVFQDRDERRQRVIT